MSVPDIILSGSFNGLGEKKVIALNERTGSLMCQHTMALDWAEAWF